MSGSADVVVCGLPSCTYIIADWQLVDCSPSLESNTEAGMVFKNSTINSLNRWIPDQNSGSYFTLEAFRESLPLWENAPIVFAKNHPDPALFAQDPEAALKKVDGVIVGYMSNARIVVEGHPRLLGSLSIMNADALQLWREGRLSLSSAFFAYRDSERRITKIESVNHILVFEETETSLPRDKSVIIQNSKTGAFVPRNPPNYGKAPENATWSAPSLSDFTSKKWDELSDTERRRIASCYAYCGGLDSFSNLKLPHHNPNGNVVWHGVANAMARLNQADIGGLKGEVEAHLKAHYKDFGKSVETEENMTQPLQTIGNTILEKLDELKNMLLAPQAPPQDISPQGRDESPCDAVANVHPNSSMGDDKSMTETELNKAIEAKDAIIASLNKEIEAEKAKTAELNKQLAEKDKIIESYKQKEKDAKFTAFLNTLKPGVYDTEEKIAELRNQFENSPQDLIIRLAAEGKFQSKIEENKTGKEHVAEETFDDTSSGLNWNALTRKWE